MNGIQMDDLDGLDRLHDLADRVSAPASDMARQAISRRTQVLRRRRQARRAIGGGVLALAVVAGTFAWRDDDRPADVESGLVAPGEEGSFPDLDAYFPGWEVRPVEDFPDAEWDASGLGVVPGAPGSFQVFRRPGELLGPTVVVDHRPASDVIDPEDGFEPVPVGDSQGYLNREGSSRFTLQWYGPGGDNHVTLRSVGLTRDEVLEFADGLRAKDDDIEFPPGPGDDFGFHATVGPNGIEEDPTEPMQELAAVRRVTLVRGSLSVEIASDTRGEAYFEAVLAERLANVEEAEERSLGGRPAVLLRSGGEWSMLWYESDAVVVEVRIAGADRAAAVEVADAFAEMPDDERKALVTPSG